MDKNYVAKRLKQNTKIRTLFKFDYIAFYSSYCSYFSPNIKSIVVSPNSITFKTSRFVSSDLVSGDSIFDLDGVLLKISPYEKEYIKL